MDPVSQKTLDLITDAGKEAVSLIVMKTTGDNHPEYEKAVISGTTAAIKELAKSDIQTAVKIYENIRIKREQRDFFNFSKVLYKFAALIKIKPKEKIKDDNDVFWGFLEHSKEISNDEMQELIAKIIAGEYNVPGTYSMSTLQIIKMLGKYELELFEKIGSLLVNDAQLPQELFTGQDNVTDFMKKIEMDFGRLQTLQSLGLFLPNSMTKTITNTEKKNLLVQYFDKTLTFRPENENYAKIELPGYYCLSTVSEQILKHLNPKYTEEYYVWLKSNYKIPNYILLEG